MNPWLHCKMWCVFGTQNEVCNQCLRVHTTSRVTDTPYALALHAYHPLCAGHSGKCVLTTRVWDQCWHLTLKTLFPNMWTNLTLGNAKNEWIKLKLSLRMKKMNLSKHIVFTWSQEQNSITKISKWMDTKNRCKSKICKTWQKCFTDDTLVTRGKSRTKNSTTAKKLEHVTG